MFIGIVADDLTGAADSVAPFAQQGYAAGVGFQGGESPGPSWDALALITGLRDRGSIKPTLIASIVRKITQQLIGLAPQIYFKKIDSTLRGHLRAELDGMRRELPGRIALICPASPANGRTVENGVLQVGSVPLSETEFVRETTNPEKFATVRSAFEMAGDPAAAEIGLASIREGTVFAEAELERHIAAGVRTLFCDAVTAEDLRTLAQILLNHPKRYLPVGSAGLTRAIAATLPALPASEMPLWNADLFTRGRILVVVGSMHAMSRRQARRLIGGPGVRHFISAPDENLLALMETISFCSDSPDEKRLLLMTPDARRPNRGAYSFEPLFHMLSLREMEQAFAMPFDGYMVTGGETAHEVCAALRGANLQICGESEPGIVRAVLNRSSGLVSVPIILKAGGFGDEGTLARCLGLE